MHTLAKMAEMVINRQTVNKNSNEMAKGPFGKWQFCRWPLHAFLDIRDIGATNENLNLILQFKGFKKKNGGSASGLSGWKINNQTPVVQTMDSTIHGINCYPADKYWGKQ